ncbi:MAG: hypothetical protein Q9162_000473 [Coniocarpon cinnabarinum]
MPCILKNAPSALGKRKRVSNEKPASKRTSFPSDTRGGREEDVVEASQSDESGDLSASEFENRDGDEEQERDIFRRAFEERFAPLQGSSTTTRQSKGSNRHPRSRHASNGKIADKHQAKDEWSGLDSDDGSLSSLEIPDSQNDSAVQIINHTSNYNTDTQDEITQRTAKRAFMTSKPPTSTSRTPNKSLPIDPNEDAQTAHEHLKNDLELSRLIQESHLLSQQPGITFQSSKPNLHSRLKTTESRLASLGARDSVLKQRNVPAVIRNGIKNKGREREDKRRREARENGIVLEKAATERKERDERRRERSVGNPSVGKFKGGMLTVGKRDLGRLTTPKAMKRGGKVVRGKRR